MKKHFILIWIIISALYTTISAQAVYITNTGEKYHTENCRYLSHSKIEIELAKALEQGYEACKVCKPTETLNSTKQETKNKEPEINNIETQFTAKTQKGTRCKRAPNCNGKCWQHGG